MKSLAVMAPVYYAWPSSFPDRAAIIPPLAGAEGVSLTRFLALDMSGGILWSGFYVALGYLFSSELDVVTRWAGHFGAALAIAIGIPLGLYAGGRGMVLLRMIHRLRLRRISPAMLDRKLKSKKESRSARPVELRRRNGR